jgi:hypothetical protein
MTAAHATVAVTSPHRRRARIAALLIVAFAARLTFGLMSELWGPDEVQVYLIGLQFFTTGAWPFYGPDVVYTATRLPGALQGLLVGGPLWLVPQPEAPYVLLNVLSFGALCLLAWYIGRRVPALPRWFLWPWVLFTPWTLNLSAHILNISYVLAGAVPFFVGACEIVPALRRSQLPRALAWTMVGFGMLWVYQLHMSAVLLVPLAGVVWLLAAREDARAAAVGLGWLALGALLSGWTVLPTLVQGGVASLAQSAGPNVVFAPANLGRVPQVVVQFFSLPTFEVARFIGAGTEARLGFLQRFWWAAPFVAAAAIGGVVQTATLIVALVRRQASGDWPAVRAATALMAGLVALSFTWSVRPPASHTIYLMLPAVMIYAAYVWAPWFDRRSVRVAAAALLICGAFTHVAIAWRNLTYQSLYTDRGRVVRAIAEKDSRVVGIRRGEMN